MEDICKFQNRISSNGSSLDLCPPIKKIINIEIYKEDHVWCGGILHISHNLNL